MAKWPKLIVISGVILILNGLFMDTTVSTGFGLVHNLGKMQRSVHLLVLGGILVIGGFIWNNSLKGDIHKPESLKDESVGTDQSLKEFLNTVQNSRQKNKEHWQKFVKEIPKDHLLIRVTTGIATGLVLLGFTLYLQHSKFDSDEINFLKFIASFLISIIGFWFSFKWPDPYKATLPILIVANFSVIIFWGALCMHIVSEQGMWLVPISIALAPLLTAHFTFRKWNRFLLPQYLLKFLLVFIGTILVMGSLVGLII